MTKQKLTPMMRQWMDAKEKHPDAILLFRMGDFYELFGDDAVLSAPILELALTCRDKDKSGMKMAGFPCHSAPNYINKLVEQGYKVAICEQLSDPKAGKGIVERGVVEVVSPGTLLEEESSGSAHNFLMSLIKDKNRWALAALDLSSATFLVSSSDNFDNVIDEISRLNPKELIIFKDDEQAYQTLSEVQKNSRFRFRIERKAEKKLNESRADSLEDKAQFLLIGYVMELSGQMPCHVGKAVHYSIEDQLLMDEATRLNLDLLPKKKGDKANLYSVLDFSKTVMAKRLLAKELSAPSTNLQSIIERQVRVKEFLEENSLRDFVREQLGGCHDISKLTALASSNKIGPRGMARLRDCLFIVEQVREEILKSSVCELRDFASLLPDFEHLKAQLDCALVESPPILLKDGALFKSGYDQELDQLLELHSNSHDMLLRIENKERESTGISSLKIKYTRVFGYYIEITKSNLSKVPAHYQRKQTIANGERYITEELSELEIKLNTAKERLAAREYELFEALRAKVAKNARMLIEMANIMSEIDMVAALAEAAFVNSWVCPKVLAKEERIISIVSGRHPVVEHITQREGSFFVPNSLELNHSDCSLALITGPNMAGKSTIMRQVALIQIMAQIGSFVPADSAQLSVCDYIFARVGASDDLSTGRSTFMVEMSETSYILEHATEFSLILLDEIGRGTSTYDGMSIAQSVAEYIHDELKTRTLFATHYHELTELEEKLAKFKNFHVEVSENNAKVQFLYTLAPGPALESFGIQVAQLAGLPRHVVERAREILHLLENKEKNNFEKPNEVLLPVQALSQGDLFNQSERRTSFPELERIAGLDINRITPVQALVKLQGLQNVLRQVIK
ncbi:MAG: DNA mismatch repair protein MutS [Myxococcales bacterium]|nr:DNA mismatch repair protein MutS [Myxococcales bacterium]USN50758.1 MAG: DNA mismatch repair protein MutS [Myxococcales bacterium]